MLDLQLTRVYHLFFVDTNMGNCICHKMVLERRQERRTYIDGKIASEEILNNVFKGSAQDIRMKSSGSIVGLGSVAFGDAKQQAIC